MIKGHAETTKFTVNFIFSGMSGLYEIISAILGDSKFTFYTVYLMKIGDILKRKEFGFGLERVLHELNPSLPCQSSLLMRKLAFGTHDVLSILETHHYNFDEISSKKNIIGYLAYKVGFSSDMKIRNLDSHTIIQKSKPYLFLLLMHLSQKNAKIAKLPRLCEITKNAIKDVLDMFLKNATIKKYFTDNLDIIAKTGSFQELMNTASNPDYLTRDATGYVLALRRGAEISKEIFSFTNMTFITRELRNKSLNYAIKISYSITLFVILFILSKG
jgi:hypothetical protein